MAQATRSQGQPPRCSPRSSESYRFCLERLRSDHPDSGLHLSKLVEFLRKPQGLVNTNEILFESSGEAADRPSIRDDPWLVTSSGLPSPATIGELGSRYHLRPEVFLGHLDIERVFRKSKLFDLPSVPFAGDNVVHLNVGQLGSFNNDPLRKMSILEQQSRADKHTLSVERDLFDCQKFGQLRIRKVDIHNERYFSVEHRITFSVGRKGTNVLLLDRTIPTNDDSLGPWMDFEPCRGRSPALLLAADYRNEFDSMGSSGSAPEGDLTKEVRSRLGDMFTSNQEPLSHHDPFDFLSGLISAALVSWSRILNMLEQSNVALEISSTPAECVAALDQLRCNICYLGRLREHIGQSYQVVQSRCAFAWSDPENESSAATARNSRRLLEAHEFLLGRGERLQQGFQTMTTLLTSSMQAVETQRTLEQAKRVEYLTKLAYFFIPVAFVSSVFGMNVKEIDENKPPLWTFFAAAGGISLLSLALLYRSTIARWFRRVRMIMFNSDFTSYSVGGLYHHEQRD